MQPVIGLPLISKVKGMDCDNIQTREHAGGVVSGNFTHSSSAVPNRPDKPLKTKRIVFMANILHYIRVINMDRVFASFAPRRNEQYRMESAPGTY